MRFRVPFCDVDMLQHVNNAAYVVWAETIRCNYFDEVFGGFQAGARGIILAKVEFEYLHPLDYREEVAVACRVSRVGQKSFDLFYEVWSESRQASPLVAAPSWSPITIKRSPPLRFLRNGKRQSRPAKWSRPRWSRLVESITDLIVYH